VDLPTYTNIWRIEKRLYKLYDLRLPMPLPLVQIGVFAGVFLPWIILLQLLRVPFHAPWHVVYIVPPGVLTWLATRPVIEGKRLTELMISHFRYLTEARTWARLTPIREPDEVLVVGRVWRRRRTAPGRVHAGRQMEQTAERQAQPAQSAPPLQAQGVHGNVPAQPAAFARPGSAERAGAGRAPEGPPRRPAAPAHAPRPSLQATPYDGTATVSPATPGGGRRPPVTRSEATRPGAAPPARPEPASTGRPKRALPPPVRGFPAPAAPPSVPAGRSADGGPAATQDTPVQHERAADTRMEGAEKAPERQSGTSHRVPRQRNVSHEPESSGASAQPAPAGPPPPARPAEQSSVPPARAREQASPPPHTSPNPPAKPGSPTGRHASSPQRPGPPPGTPPAPDTEQTSQRPGGAAPARPSKPGPSGDGSPTAPVIPLVPGGRHARPADRTPVAPESPVPAARSGRPHDAGGQRPSEPAAQETGTASDDDEQAIAAARTDQIVWPANTRGKAGPRPGADDPGPRSAPPGPFGRPGAQARSRSHGKEPAPPREARSPMPAQSPPGPRPPSPPKPAPNPPSPPNPAAPPKVPAAGLAPPLQVPLPPAAPPPEQAPAARPVTPPARQGGPQGRGGVGATPPESPARGVRSGPASPVRPGPMPQPAQDEDGRDDDGRGLRRIFSGGGQGDGDYEERVRTAFEGARRVVVLGCTGGAGQTVTGLMLGHTFAQHRGDRIVAVDVNPGPGAMARRTRTETRETLTSLITHAEQVTGYQMMRRYTSVSKSGLEVVAAGKNPVQALDDRDYALAMRTLDRFYSITLLDAAAAVVARVLPYADQIVLVAPASSDAPRAVAMTFEWLDGHGYEGLRAKAVTVINGVSRRSMDDVEHAESVARGRCRALVRIPWDDHLSLDRAPRNELRTLRAPTRKAYIALGGVVAGGLVQVPERYPRQEVSR
jgi:MinD-like ATPase involved in chromosome partitioning or flagellar assembly